ncbi:MAG TPA: ribonuclease III [Tessaracoccus flavescens]|uniref:Ribonuclease 3 n=1 Tax=Tessaracoccus flavescens TaxID=399497 RepID=A0A921EP52_9ACTN|nr:ribonuclease III [Tessaracoccus flavescens]
MSRLQDQLKELGIEVDAQLFELSFTHRSYAYEAGGLPSNERLEFLGDAVLQICVTEHIYRSYPDLAEGQLAKLRAHIVSAVALAKVARSLDVGDHILLGKGELATKGRDKTSILADTFEAIIGAIYLSAGRDAAERFLHHNFDPRIAEAEQRGDYTDHKTALQEICAQRGWAPPRYEITGSGPDHLREFTAIVYVDDQPLGSGVAPSKKHAELIAARAAYRELAGA